MRRDEIRVSVAVGTLGATALGAVALADIAIASNVAAGLGDQRDLEVPTWLYLLTGGAAIGASGLLAALVTDRTFVDAIHEWSVPLFGPRETRSTRRFSALLGRTVGVALFVAVVVVGLVGPPVPTANLAVLVTFVGVRSLLPIVAVLVVDPWPTVDPFRTIATAADAVVPDRLSDALEYPDRLRTWPAVAGLFALVWLELVLPITTDPGALALFALCYAGYAVAGALAFSPETWFRHGDPLAVLFRLYGSVAPIQRDDDGYRLVLPGSWLRRPDVVADSSEVAFVLLIVWELTFSGFVVTPPGARTIEAIVFAGVPPRGAYLLALCAGYALFLGGYLFAAAVARRTAPTYLTGRVLAVRFAPPLLAIAAGYHLAHYVAFSLNLAPALVDTVANPLAPPVNPTTLALPAWVGALEVATVVCGHLLAIWTAHATAFDRFPGRLQAIRSQYPFVVVMIWYTVCSLWVLSLPASSPPFVA